MAENLDLNINIGANISDLDAAMQKAQNLLVQFQAALKKATNIGEINYLNNQIENLGTTIKNINSQMSNMNKPTNDATNALSNLSRVAQDAPYGFMGIANNLNPLLESFQQLSKKSDGAAGALKAMVDGLTGPAGIGLAVGVVSSLIVKFGDKLFESSEKQKQLAEKSKEHADALKEQKNALDQIYDSTAKEATQISSLIAVLENENETRYRKQKALEELKKLNPEIFNGLKLEEGVVIGLNSAYEQYINSLSSIITLKIKQKELEDVTEKILKAQGVTLSQEEKDIIATGKAINDKVNAQRTDIELRNNATKALTEQNKKELELNGLIEQRKKIFDSIKDVSTGVKIQGETNIGGGDKESPYIKALNDFNASLRQEDVLVKNNLESTQVNLDNKIKIYEDFIKKLAAINTNQAKDKIEDLLTPLTEMQMTKFEQRIKDSLKSIDKQKLQDIPEPKDEKGGSNKILLNALTGETGTKQSEKSFTSGKKEMDEFFKDTKKNFDEAEKSAEKFANTVATSVTNGLMSMFDAMQQGQSPLQALSGFFADLLKQLAAAVIQATLFQAIMSLLPGGGAVAGAAGGSAMGGGGIFGILGSLFGAHAEGGITSGPSFGVIGEAGPEAIMPLSKLGNMLSSTFQAGAMNSNAGGDGGGQFVLKGSDLVLAMQRSNFSLNVRR